MKFCTYIYFLKYYSIFKCTLLPLLVFCCFCLIFMNVHFKTPCWNGTVWKRSLIRPRRGFPWVLSPCIWTAPKGLSFSKWTPHWSCGSVIWRRTGPQVLPEEKEHRTACLAVSRLMLSLLIWVCMFLCTMDFEHLDFFNRLHFNYQVAFSFQPLCFAW